MRAQLAPKSGVGSPERIATSDIGTSLTSRPEAHSDIAFSSSRRSEDPASDHFSGMPGLRAGHRRTPSVRSTATMCSYAEAMEQAHVFAHRADSVACCMSRTHTHMTTRMGGHGRPNYLAELLVHGDPQGNTTAAITSAIARECGHAN